MVDTTVVLLTAVLGVLLAGFASLVSSPSGGGDGAVRAAWRKRFVMTAGFNVAVASLGVVAIAAFTDEKDLLVRLAMGLVLLITLTPLPWALRSLRDQNVFRTQGEIAGWLIGEALFRVLALVNLFVASEKLLVLVFVLWVAGAITVYLNGGAEVYPPAGSQEKASHTG